jgi:hypothetical protein
MNMQPFARYSLIVVVLAVLGVLAFFGFKYYQYVQATDELPAEGSVVVFSYGGVGRQYLYSNESLNRRIDSTREDGAVIYEEIQSPLNIDDKLILATAPELTGMFLGVKHGDGEITALMTGKTNKVELSAHKDGLAVFTASEVRPPLPSVSGPADEGAESETEEHYTAENPLDAEPAAFAQASLSQLYAVEIDTGKIIGLGAGRSPRFTSDGFVVALAENGVVRIDPKTGTRTLLIERQEGALNGAVSPDGSIVALPAPDAMSLEFFSLADPANPRTIGYMMFDKAGPYPTAFTDNEHFFIRLESRTAHLYQIPTEKIPVATPVAIVGVNE